VTRGKHNWLTAHISVELKEGDNRTRKRNRANRCAERKLRTAAKFADKCGI